MMTPRRVAVLAIAALLVMMAALWLGSRRDSATTAHVGSPVLPRLDALLNEVARVRIESKSEAATLVRTGAGWTVEERGFRADPAKLRRLLLGLADLKVIEEKTSDPAKYAQLGVEDPGPEATGTHLLATAAGTEFALIIGKVADSASVYVRVPGSGPSLLAAPRVAADADPKHWLDTALVDLPADRIESVAVTPATGPAWRATRGAATEPLALQGLPKGKVQRSPEIVTPVAALLVNLHAEDVHAAARTGAAAPAPRVVVRTFDGVEIELHGRTEGERHYIHGTARSTGAASEKEAAELAARIAGFEFELPRYKYDALFRPLADFT
ncbi:MAG TPA: DUF4340 domain-containing protein [Steroidobacteraceae bacterium]|jgi:hypothetical protein|nr:DUF4340 domain-containing protein [Steroidobacteraceae bacterium]HNS27603.1 DUF4340 domain-containing protein [Steroidobacteraceae bacterium]